MTRTTIPSGEAAQRRAFSDIGPKFDSLLGGTLAAGAALLKANSQRTRSFDTGDGASPIISKRLMIEDVSDYQTVDLPNLFKITIQGGSQHENLTAYVEVDPKRGDIAEVVDGSAQDDQGNLLWEEADETLREKLFGVLRMAAAIEARQDA